MIWPTLDSGGLLLVERQQGLTAWDQRTPARRPPWTPPVDGTFREILKRYRGFDGIQLWPPPQHEAYRVFGALAPTHLESSLREALSEETNSEVLDLVYVITEEGTPNPPEAYEFAGYDFGTHVFDDGRYSVVLHDIIFGLDDEVRACASLLNNHLLFDSLGDLYQFERVRDARANSLPDLVEPIKPADEAGAVAIYAVERATARHA